MEFLYPI